MARLAQMLVVITFLVSLLVPLFGEAAGASSLSHSEKKQIDRAIHLSAAYLSAQMKPDGSFHYRRHVDRSVKLKKRYNMLRHAGTIYALADYASRFKDERLSREIGRAVDYLRKASLAPVGDSNEILAVWSDPTITGSRKPLTAKLGGAGLALVAMIACRKVNCTAIPDEELRRLGRFILFMQRDDGSIYSKYTPSEGGKRGDWVSLYYPGEAALGLVMLFEITGEKKWFEGGYRALLSLSQERRFSGIVPADHWALLATEKIWPHISPEERVPLALHARQIVQHILSEQVTSDDPAFDGGFAPDGRTTPTATRLEGLLAARTVFAEDEKLRRDIENAAMMGVDFLISAQIDQGPLAGGMPRGTRKIENPQNRREEAFNRRVGEVRIDYVQHLLSALMQMKSALGLAGKGDT
ncbi:MAG: hypothetical protein AAFW47_03780 [Pseudomonadota bacterium]